VDIPDTGYLRVLDKHISEPNKRYSELLGGVEYDFIPFTASPGNMVDMIMAVGDRYCAVNAHKNTKVVLDNDSDTTSNGWFNC
jgi:hypothetical protein